MSYNLQYANKVFVVLITKLCSDIAKAIKDAKRKSEIEQDVENYLKAWGVYPMFPSIKNKDSVNESEGGSV